MPHRYQASCPLEREPYLPCLSFWARCRNMFRMSYAQAQGVFPDDDRALIWRLVGSVFLALCCRARTAARTAREVAACWALLRQRSAFAPGLGNQGALLVRQAEITQCAQA